MVCLDSQYSWASSRNAPSNCQPLASTEGHYAATLLTGTLLTLQ